MKPKVIGLLDEKEMRMITKLQGWDCEMMVAWRVRMRMMDADDDVRWRGIHPARAGSTL